MDRPAWREYGLIVVYEQMPCRLRLPQKMTDDGLAKIEVEIDFGAPRMRVRGHGVPDASLGQFGETHHELAGFDAVGVNVLINLPLVRAGLRAQGDGLGFLLTDQRGGIGVVRGA